MTDDLPEHRAVKYEFLHLVVFECTNQFPSEEELVKEAHETKQRKKDPLMIGGFVGQLEQDVTWATSDRSQILVCHCSSNDISLVR